MGLTPSICSQKEWEVKDYFPLPFIDQVLDTLVGKKYFSFLDGFSGYNRIQITSEDQEKTTFTCLWGTYAYKVLPFGLCNAPTTFLGLLSIWGDFSGGPRQFGKSAEKVLGS